MCNCFIEKLKIENKIFEIKMNPEKKLNKDSVFIFDKKALDEPLSDHSKYIKHLVDNDPDQPGLEFEKKK